MAKAMFARINSNCAAVDLVAAAAHSSSEKVRKRFCTSELLITPTDLSCAAVHLIAITAHSGKNKLRELLCIPWQANWGNFRCVLREPHPRSALSATPPFGNALMNVAFGFATDVVAVSDISVVIAVVVVTAASADAARGHAAVDLAAVSLRVYLAVLVICGATCNLLLPELWTRVQARVVETCAGSLGLSREATWHQKTRMRISVFPDLADGQEVSYGSNHMT